MRSRQRNWFRISYGTSCDLRFEIAPTDESEGLRSGCGAFFKDPRMNPRDCDQSAFAQIIVEKHGEKITVYSVPREGAKFAIAIFVK